MILRNLLYVTAIVPVNFAAGTALFVLVSLWAMLRTERASG